MSETPRIVALGDAGLLVRFAERLDDEANARAVGFAHVLERNPLPGVVEIVPNLISVLLRYDPARIGFRELSGEVQMLLPQAEREPVGQGTPTEVTIRYGGEEGPDLDEVATASGLDRDAFIARHSAAALRVLAIGFAPGFAYLGFHHDLTPLPRRGEVRPMVPAGTVLYAAGQTALTATAIPTGWHVIGRTGFCNFMPEATPPVRLTAGDAVRLVAS